MRIGQNIIIRSFLFPLAASSLLFVSCSSFLDAGQVKNIQLEKDAIPRNLNKYYMISNI